MKRNRGGFGQSAAVGGAGCGVVILGVLLNMFFWLGLLAGALWLLRYFGVI